MQFKDTETDKIRWVDTSDKQTRENFASYRKQQQTLCTNEMKKYGIDNIRIRCGEDYIKQLVKLFAAEGRR